MLSRRMKKRIIQIHKLFGLVLIILVLASCTATRMSTAQLPQYSEVGAVQTAPSYTFGIVYPMAHSFYEVVTERAEQAAVEHHIEIIVKAPDEPNLEQQIRIMETLIRQGVDGIAIAPIDSAALAPYIDQAVQSGIPVVCFESDAPESMRATYIGSDNLESGLRIGQAIDQLLEGRGMILLETGMDSMRSLDERLEGFLTYIRDETEIDVLDVRYNEGKSDLALAELERMIDDHPHFDAFVSLDYISGASSVLVWKAMGLNRYVLTLGMMPDLAEAIRNGQITSAISQNEVLWGELIVRHLLWAQEGRALPELVDTGITLVDVDNNLTD